MKQFATVVNAEEVSFSLFGSESLVIVVSFVYSLPLVPAGTWPTSVKVLVVPPAKVEVPHITGEPLTVHMSHVGPDVFINETNVIGILPPTLLGNVSLNCTLVAVFDPIFATVIV